jgi:hypothetical protein
VGDAVEMLVLGYEIGVAGSTCVEEAERVAVGAADGAAEGATVGAQRWEKLRVLWSG